jgi:hypothetical protein
MSITAKLPMPLYNLTTIQKKYRNSESRFIITSAGRRSRKTLIGKRKVFECALRNPNTRYFHGAPTNKQAKDIFWDDLKKYAALFIVHKNESNLYVTLGNGSEIHVLGLDVPARIEGQVWHGCHITEYANIKANAWGENIRPALSDTKGFAIFDGVPEGRNHYFDMAVNACGGAIPETRPEIGSYGKSDEWEFFSWWSSDVIDPAEVAQAEKDLDPKTFRQEYKGSFEAFSGLAYYTFGRHNLHMVKESPKESVAIGMDFNVNPMTAVLGHIRGNAFHQFGEVWLENSNTYEMKNHLLEKYSNSPDKVIIFPDSTGKNRESNATESDLSILERAGFIVRANESNPYVKDRVNAINTICQTAEYKKDLRYLVNPETCPKTVNEMNKVERLDDGRLDKDQEKLKIGHITAGLGYLVSYNWPVKEQRLSTSQRRF